jgi:hypothetical protein
MKPDGGAVWPWVQSRCSDGFVSMATPHVAGTVYERREVRAGHLNAYDAVRAAQGR